jgi:hypothetical protein
VVLPPKGSMRRCSTGHGSPRSWSTCMWASSYRVSGPLKRWPSCSTSLSRRGTVTSMTRPAAGGLNGFLALMRARITGSEVVHFDETGFRVDGGCGGCTPPQPGSTR